MKRESQKKKKLAVAKGLMRRRETKRFSLLLKLDRKWRLRERTWCTTSSNFQSVKGRWADAIIEMRGDREREREGRR
jgi:hypothetical protein